MKTIRHKSIQCKADEVFASKFEIGNYIVIAETQAQAEEAIVEHEANKEQNKDEPTLL